MNPPKKSNSKKRKNEEYLRIFMEFDVDNSGSVSKKEIIKVLKACEMEIDEGQAEDLINEIDADGGGQLQQDEFIEFLKKEDEQIQYTSEQLQKMFGYFALKQPHSQSIGFQQLKSMFECLGQKITDLEVLSMITYADRDKDGRINFEQFCNIMKQV